MKSEIAVCSKNASHTSDQTSGFPRKWLVKTRLSRKTFIVASSALGPKNSRSRKLKDTLGELESALSDWDQIIAPAHEEGVASADGQSRPRTCTSGMPEEMKRRTRDLLNQLKEQIDELSTEEKPAN